MSAQSATHSPVPPGAPWPPRVSRARALAAAAAAHRRPGRSSSLGRAGLVEPADHAVREIQLPLRHDDIIRQQAADKNVDASLIAAVIYTESRFRDQTSHAGAKGLMQIMPETADYIARKSGGTQFTRADLATPQINIAYGTWYLRYLLDKYEGNTILTLAAYNGGEGKVDEWRAEAAATRREVPRRLARALQGDARLRRARALGPHATTARPTSANSLEVE